MQIISTENAPAAIGPYSQAVAVGSIVYTSGQIPLCPASGEIIGGDIAAQTEQVMKNLSAVLDAAGSGIGKVIKTTCYLADMNDFSLFNQVYERYIGSQKPARSCVAVKDLPRGVLVEVEAIGELSY